MRSAAVLILAVFFTLAAAPASSPSADPTATLIARLGDEDPAAREDAARRLLAMGQDAREAILTATKSPYPEIASRATDLLGRLPWSRPDDSPSVKRLLAKYGAVTERERITVISAIARLAVPESNRVLVRLLQDEPGENVRWAILDMLMTRRSEMLPLASLRNIAPDTTDSVPLLAAAALAWNDQNAKRAQALLERAAELLAGGGDQPPAADFIYQDLTRLYLSGKQFAAAADLQRRRVARDPTRIGQDLPAAVRDLFALHARFGPLPSLADDLHDHAIWLYRPELLYCIGRMFDRTGHDRLAGAADLLAYAAGLFSQASRYHTGDFLARNNWAALARRELLTVLLLPGQNKDLIDGNTHFRLANLYIAASDDFRSAEHFRLGLESLDRCNAVLTGGSRQTVEAEMHWRYLRAIVAGKRRESADPHFARLLELAPTSASIALEVVPMLKQLHRDQDAQRLFSAPYASLKRRLAAERRDPQLSNELAWLCARCDERLKEAIALANTAIAAEPDNAAYLDTAAEVNFRLGHRDEAIRLETRALSLRPDDTFMREQLKRFSK